MPIRSQAVRMMAGVALVGLALGRLHAAGGPLPEHFLNPPSAARPWVYWFPLDGNLTREGITADLEAMARVGIGGVLTMETAQGTPKGPVPFASEAWYGMLGHAFREAARLGLEVNMNNDAGWCGSGGPWITPELSMQRLVWTETAVTGPGRFDGTLPRPQAVRDYYRDIAVLAYPTPAKGTRIQQLRGKSMAVREEVPLRTSYPALPPEAVITRGSIVELTARLTPDGGLEWEIPAGAWTILRLGHTTTGRENHPAPSDGRGLECDKLSRDAVETHFRHLLGRLAAANREVTGSGRTFVRAHIDSWEVGSQNWTPGFREEFRRLRGYDPLPLLPVLAGCVVDGAEVSERFLWDVRMTIAELLAANYAGQMRELAHRHGLELSIEAYGDGPFDNLAYAGQTDEPMSEFWSWSRFGAAGSCLEMSSAAHVYGKPIHGAEAFTATDAERWQGHPGNIKDIGDWAFCAGINRFVFHRYALQPWRDVRPGVSMGPWGLHYERTQTWWEQSRAWHMYLARCQVLLQQGLVVADLCFLMPENAPQSFHSPVKGSHERPGWSFDGCPPEALLTRMEARDGRIVLPDGMNYRLLVLPRVGTMTPRLLGRVLELVQAGATVLGNPPLRSPSLSGYPECDAEVGRLARELWGNETEPPDALTERTVGKGRVVWGRELQPTPDPEYPTESALGRARWIWFDEGQPARSAPVGSRFFRRTVPIDAAARVASARLAITADNEFECWVNGRRIAHGDDWQRVYTTNVAHLLRGGPNVIAVTARNGAETANPAGLVAALTVRFADGRRLEVVTDETWEASRAAEGDWRTAASVPGWRAAATLGPLGMAPWGELEEGAPGSRDPTVDLAVASRVLAGWGVEPDFACLSPGNQAGPRYIHKRAGETDFYFLANREAVERDFVCAFRVAGKRPELWWPDTGRIEAAAAFEPAGPCTRLPLRLGPFGSVFVVFREPLGDLDPVVTATRDGKAFLPEPKSEGDLVVVKAVYGLLEDAAATRDVTAKVQALADGGTLSFPVAEMAKGDDPAYGQVKTLRVDYTVNGEPFSASSTDGRALALVAPAPPLAATLRLGEDGRPIVEAGRPGRFELRTASGKIWSAAVPPFPARHEIRGPWTLEFPPDCGAPARVTLPELVSWSEHADNGIRSFSGTAAYRTTFDLPEAMLGDARRLILDLGRVEIMAEVILNGQTFDVLWKRPFETEVTQALRPGANTLEVRVVNLWINRLIGDEMLPEDSPRNRDGRTLTQWPEWVLAGKPSPTGRFTFTSHRLWSRNDPLVPSGLLGPVTLRACVRVPAR
ncbi:MAG: hypothetical protein JXR77_08310 [Lentisphaeria bacterium]|nr:hypothetical protein [Lentisphaeria bacterium]